MSVWRNRFRKATTVRPTLGVAALGVALVVAPWLGAAPLPNEDDPMLAAEALPPDMSSGPSLGALPTAEPAADSDAPAGTDDAPADADGAPADADDADQAEPSETPSDDRSDGASPEASPPTEEGASETPADRSGDVGAVPGEAGDLEGEEGSTEITISDADPDADAVSDSEVRIADGPAVSENPPATAAPQPLDRPGVDKATLPPLSDELLALRNQVRQALAQQFRNRLNTRDHNPWEMMHGVIAYGVHAQVLRGGTSGDPVNAISYLSINGACHGIDLLHLDPQGRLRARKGLYVQGHDGQLLAILAQCHVPADYPISVQGRSFTVRDLVRSEMETCQTNTELTFKLISLAHYLHTDDTWQDEQGGEWSIPRLIQEEIRQPILKVAACGGTHRLMGLIYAVQKRIQHGRPIEGQFKRALTYTQDYQKYAFALQNPDGSFSTKWFERPENKPDVDRKLKTSGHIIEWLSYSLPDEQLTDPRMIRAVNFLSGILVREPGRAWEIGPKGHALHALRIYDRRLFKPYDARSADSEAAPVAQGEPGDEAERSPNSEGGVASQPAATEPTATATMPTTPATRRGAKPVPLDDREGRLPPFDSLPDEADTSFDHAARVRAAEAAEAIDARPRSSTVRLREAPQTVAPPKVR